VSKSQILYDDPVDHPVREIMEFRLLYAGNWLKAASQRNTRAWEKHSLRRHFHAQLKSLWRHNPTLNWYGSSRVEHGGVMSLTFEERLAEQYSRAEIGFVPLINKSNGLVCELEILILRPGPPGELIKHGGDIDNRVKVLLDSLRMPEDASEMKRMSDDEPDPNPMYCLLQDDSLITKLTITVDQLLIDMDKQTDASACVVITVNTKSISAFITPMELLT